MAAKLANGRPRTASAVSVTSAFEQVQVVGVHGPPHPEDRDDDGQSHADFGHRDRDDEQREDQPGQVGLEARERHEVDVDRVQHQLDAEQDADGIPPRQHTEEPDGEDERGQNEVRRQTGSRHQSSVRAKQMAPSSAATRSTPSGSKVTANAPTMTQATSTV